MKIGIKINNQSFSPEAFAYEEYLNANNENVYLFYESIEDNTDLVIDLMGFRAFKKKNIKYIHDYSSLSTPPFASVKNVIKKFVNFKPSKRIFNCNNIKNGFNFKDKIPYILRDTGVDSNFLSQANIYNNKNDYDLIYSGTSFRRYGLIDALTKLSKNGFKIAVVGKFSKEKIDILKNFNINYLGQFKRNEMPKIYKIANGGLNFTPDIYPYNLQNSTKIKEYCASGLNIISNKYQWVEEFESKNQAKFLWYNPDMTVDDFYNFKFKIPDMQKYEWNNILRECNFLNFIRST